MEKSLLMSANVVLNIGCKDINVCKRMMLIAYFALPELKNYGETQKKNIELWSVIKIFIPLLCQNYY